MNKIKCLVQATSDAMTGSAEKHNAMEEKTLLKYDWSENK